MVVQVLSGFILALYYVGGAESWPSVIELTREVRGGWILRLIHGNTASFVFLVMFMHFIRGLVQRSFYLTWPWLRGWLIMAVTMAAAFLGYVLPWGQISFWGATVIINLLRVLPMGKSLVIWLWGGFYVSSFTGRFFYALHFLLPFVVLALAGMHLILLHLTGRRVPGGVGLSRALKLKFSQIFSIKDLVNLRLWWLIWFTLLAIPDWSADPVNFEPSDLSRSPLHIQPEWYFLHLYAILRSIPNKVGGLVAFALALILLLALVLVLAQSTLNQTYFYNYVVWGFVAINVVLLWLGIQAVEAPFITIGQLIAVFYFRYFYLVLMQDNVIYWLLVK